MKSEGDKRVARIGLGTAQFGLAYGVSNIAGQVAAGEVAAILARAEAVGIHELDTAPAYGTAEDVLGRLGHVTGAFAICTKTLSGGADAATIGAGIARSVKRLKRRTLDCVLVHDATQLLGAEGDAVWAQLRAARDVGLTRKIGISAYVHHDPLALARRFKPDVMQVPVSLLDQRLVGDGTLERLKEMGIVIQARSIFLQGLPFLNDDQLPLKLRGAGPRLAEIRRLVEASGATMLQALVGFVLDQASVDVALVGVTTVAELNEIMEAARSVRREAVDWARCAISDETVITPSLWQGS